MTQKQQRPADEGETAGERTCDALVIGSGAGGLSTAIVAAHQGLDVIVAEKADLFGGTSARSGGWMWIPCNPLAVKAGVEDSIDAARTYLKDQTGENYNSSRIDAFLANGPKAISFFEENTVLKFDVGLTFPDYHPEAPGGMNGGRSIVAQPYDGRELGKDFKRMRPPAKEMTLFGMQVGSGGELAHFYNVVRSARSAAIVGGLLAKYGRDWIFHGRGTRLTNGNALVGRLARSAFDAGVPIWTSTPARSLIIEGGVVRGAVLERDGKTVRVIARRGVVLAAGGFSWDIERRKKFYHHTDTGHDHWTLAPESNTGDGIALGEATGGSQLTGLPHAAAWMPVSHVPQRDGSHRLAPHLVDRGKPGVIAVDLDGRRFVNEADSYHDFCAGLIGTKRPDREAAAYLIADHATQRRYGLGFAKPHPMPLRPHVRSGYLLKSDTIEGLARAAGIDPDMLGATVKRFNENAVKGIDPDFGRGSGAYNVYAGDATHQPNPSLGPIGEGPYYAVKVHTGDLGSYAGLRVDERARVLDDRDQPIPGLFAAGTDAASIMGGQYPGGGCVLGPIITFGYIAGRTLAGANDLDAPHEAETVAAQ